MSPTPDDRERIEKLMMAALDGELDAGGRAELERALAADEALRTEWERLSRVKEVTKTMRYVAPPNEVWDAFWSAAYNRVERGVGWVLFLLGAALLSGWGLWVFIEEVLGAADVPWPLKLGLVATALGGLVLGVSVLREKVFARRRDRYRGIER